MGAPPQTKALFLDRDGVINVDKNYVWRIEDFEFLPDIFELCRAAQTVGLLPIIVTNQAGIGRGYYTEQDFQTLTEWMLAEFSAQGIGIGRVYHCPYHPTEGIGAYRRDSPSKGRHAAPCGCKPCASAHVSTHQRGRATMRRGSSGAVHGRRARRHASRR